MKALLKSSLILSLLLSFIMTSCDSDGEGSNDVEDLKGIQLVTTRSNGESEGIGLACNFGQIIKEHLEDKAFDEIKDELDNELDKEGEEHYSEKFDELLEDFFGSFSDKTMYMIVAGENIELENKEAIGVKGETFSLSWFSNTEEPIAGTYEARGAKINVENPDDLEKGAKVSEGKIKVILTTVNEESMIGTFSGIVNNNEGAAENISGEFNVERISCEK